jgi:glycyl-tRNA synthetase
MAEPKENPLMEKIVSLCKRRGFVFQSSEIYGGINGFWDYGPLGAELKRNVKELWWNTMTRQRDDVAGLEATIIMSPQIWKASGHVDTFSDPMCDCKLCGKRFRADQIEPQSGVVYQFTGAESLLDEFESDLQDMLLKATDKITDAAGQSDLEQIKAGREDFLKVKKSLDILRPKIMTSAHRFDALEALTRPFEKLAALLSKSGNEQDQAEAQRLGKLVKQTWQDFYVCDEPISILLKDGEHPDSARKKARKFYEKRNYFLPKLNGEKIVSVTQTTRFCPEDGAELSSPKPFNLMFKTYVGPVESEDGIAYLRPETAQAIFAQFKNVLETSRQKVPFGIAQVGKAFRNEVTPRNFTFRSREFEQMELEFFIKPDEVVEAISGSVAAPQGAHGEPQPNWGWQAWHQYWVEERVRFYEGIGLSRETLGFHKQTPAELAHYARACTDILFKFPFSKKDEHGNVAGDELEGIAARSDFDLSQHQRFSSKPMGVFDDELRAVWGKLPKEKQDDLWKRYYDNRKNYLTKSARPDETAEQISKQATDDANGLAKGQYIPHVIEPSAGVDRLILALIANAYSEITETDDKGKSETRVTMKFHPRVAPIKVGVFPLLKNKPELVAKAREVYEFLRPHLKAFYDEGGAIGRRYARQDEAGTPFCVTIDFDTLGEKPELLDTVTIRYRDDGKQDRLKISDLLPMLLEKIR